MKIDKTICRLIAAIGLLASLPGMDAVADAPTAPEIIYQASSPFYDNIFVVDENGWRSLRFGSATGDDQTLISIGHPEQLPMPYLRAAAVGLTVPDNMQRMLMIGLGGGSFASFTRSRLPDVYIDAVEIDPIVAKIAREYFYVLEEDKLKVHVMDAVDYLQQDNRPYDYILLDAYDADEIPQALTTTSFLSNVSKMVSTDGVVVANVATPNKRQTRALISKLATHFGHCLHLRSLPHFNHVLLLAAHPLPTRAELIDRVRSFDPGLQISETMPGLESYAKTARPCQRRAP